MNKLILTLSFFLFIMVSCDRVDPYPPEALEENPDEITNGSFTLVEPEHITTGPAGTTFLESHGSIINLTEGPLNVSWQKNYLDAPQSWNYSMCDPAICYLPSVSGASFFLMQDSTGLMDMRFYPSGTTGEGEGSIFVWLTNDSAASVLEMKFTALAE
ncbi:MAG: hypothetical protein HKN39_05440 [Flavobacteriales bacterium]|nr:hypothetical protein [Flavobacteriales bacterium]